MVLDADAAIRARDLWVPYSAFASREAREMFARQQAEAAAAGPQPVYEDPVELIHAWRASADAQRDAMAEAMLGEFPVTVESSELGGVRVDVIVPRDGVPTENAGRVLINLHGGGMVFGAGGEGRVMSIPIAARAGVKVVSVDYRMAPEHRYPAASEDVAAVYAALLEEYEPEGVGLYGYSAGAALTGWSLAWFQRHGLPRPGAAGFFGGSIPGSATGGDSVFLAPVLMGGEAIPSDFASQEPNVATRAFSIYTSGADAADPAFAPLDFPEILAGFPPSLFINSGRDASVSSATHAHLRLVTAGVHAELYIWDGLWHAALYESSLPETRERYGIIAAFFDRHLA